MAHRPTQPELRPLTIVLAGKSGVGKTALWNNLLGSNRENFTPDSTEGTRQFVTGYTKFGTNCICIIDTPGLKEAVADKIEQLKKLAKHTNKHHQGYLKLLLYCIPIGPGSRFEDFNPIAMRCLQDAYGESIWMHCILVFTMGNLALKYFQDHYPQNEVDVRYALYVQDYVHKFKSELHNLQVKDVNVVSIINTPQPQQGNTIVAIPAGFNLHDHMPRISSGIPNSQVSWRQTILEQVIWKCDSLPKPLQLNYQYRNEVYDTAKWACTGILSVGTSAALVCSIPGGLAMKAALVVVLGTVAGIGMGKGKSIVKRAKKRLNEVTQDEQPLTKRSRMN